VHADETSWSIHSLWSFVTEQARILLHRVHKDAATLEKIFDPVTFVGLVTSDDAAVYSKFDKMQKCWAYLFRKANRIEHGVQGIGIIQGILSLTCKYESSAIEQASDIDAPACQTRVKRVSNRCVLAVGEGVEQSSISQGIGSSAGEAARKVARSPMEVLLFDLRTEATDVARLQALEILQWCLVTLQLSSPRVRS
jgi:hypothetical protein